jgi:4-hydroxybenzoate polyprenyltransferase
MAFTAVSGELPPLAWLVFCAVVLWVLVYDTEYAMTDREDDLRIGIRSTAVLLGDLDRPFIALAQGLMLLDLLLIGRQAGLGFAYGLGLACATALFGYQQWLIRQREPTACLKAFLNNQWAGLVIFVGIAVDYALRTAQVGGTPIN